MTDILNTKLAEVRKQKEQTVANYNALCGAEQMILQLIAQVEKEGKGDDSN